jgi:hypothetical protein
LSIPEASFVQSCCVIIKIKIGGGNNNEKIYLFYFVDGLDYFQLAVCQNRDG